MAGQVGMTVPCEACGAVKPLAEPCEACREKRAARIERECIEQVFGLTGGELETKPWATLEYTFRFWYGGAPQWSQDFDHDERCDGSGFYMRTAVSCELHGASPEYLMDAEGELWVRVASYLNSGETQCPCTDCDEDPYEGRTCELCGDTVDERARLDSSGKPEGHGYIYLGDGWCELVYRRQFGLCEECSDEIPPVGPYLCADCATEVCPDCLGFVATFRESGRYGCMAKEVCALCEGVGFR